MRVIAYMALHYGAEYLHASIKSIENHVEKIVILYTDRPSYGHLSKMACPETEEELRAIAEAASSKVEWHRGRWNNEGEHRSYIYNLSKGYDLVLATDSDEVWNEESLAKCLERAAALPFRFIGVQGYVNFWRSFNHVCRDGFAPIRIINLKHASGTASIDGLFYHFSTAQSDKIMRYKYEIHGHKSEIRPRWLDRIYFGWKEGDEWLHPVSLQIWHRAEPFDKQTLPDILKQHPNFNKEVIS